MAQPQWVAESDASSATGSFLTLEHLDEVASQPSMTSTERYVPVHLRQKLKRTDNSHKIAELQHKIAELQWEAEELEAKKAKTLGPKLPTFNLPFFLRKSKMAFLQDRFPRTTFRCTSDNAHDHPLAHTETMIATKKGLRLAPAGGLVIDYFGSASAMDAFNVEQARSHTPKVGLAYIDKFSPKAFIRHRRLGQPIVNGRMRYIEYVNGVLEDLGVANNTITVNGVEYTGEMVTWFTKHTMYYMSDETIQDCLNVEGSHMVSIIHRHPKESGNLFDGECSYAKKAGSVQQVNKLTGESYTHRDLSWLWDSQEKVRYNSNGAFTWTFHMVSEDTWIIELTAIPKYLNERFRKREEFLGTNGAVAEMTEHDMKPSDYPHPALAELPMADCKLVGGIPVISFGDTELPDCQLTCPELFEFLSATAVGRPRDEDLLQSLFALARSHALNASEFPGKKGFQVRAEDIAGHVVLAWMSGIKKETYLLRAAACHQVWKHEHHALLDGVHINSNTGHEGKVQGVLLAAKRVNRVAKNQTFAAILESTGRV